MPPPGLPSYYRNWDSPFSYAPPPTPLPFGLSHQDLAGMGAGGAALTSLAPMLSEYARNRFGAFGFTFGSGMNPATTEYGRDFMRQQMSARQAGAEADQAGLNDVLRGLAVVIGHRPDQAATQAANDGRVRFDEAGERMISRMASDSSKMLPFLAAMMPDAVDAALPGGSRTVAAGAMNAANRFRIDPTTGRSLAEDAQFSNRIIDPLIAGGRGTTDGLLAGRVGTMYAELATRGLVGGSSDRVMTQEDAGGLLGVAATGLPSQARVREGQADRIREQVSGYAKTVAAINEIFAENGRANAPMQELIQGLESMTQGGLSMYRADQLTRIVRTFQGAGQASGLSLEAMQGMAGAAGAQLAAVGGHRGLAAPAALYAAAAGAAFNRSEYSVGAETGGQAEQIAMTLGGQTSFAGSEMANVIGALDVQSRYLGAGGGDTDLGKVVANMKAGRFETTLGDGSTFDVRTASGAQLTALARNSGLSETGMMRQLQFGTRQNRAAFVGNDQYTQGLGVAGQRYEVERSFSATHGKALDDAFGGGRHQEFFAALYQAANAEGVVSVDQAVKLASARLGNAGAANDLGPLVDSMFGQVANARGLTDVSGIATLRNFSPDFQGRAGRAMQEFDERGERARQLAQLNPGTTGQSLMDAVARSGMTQGAGGYYNPETGQLDYTKAALFGGLGGVMQEEANRALGRGPRTGIGVVDWATDTANALRPTRPNAGAGPNAGATRIFGEIILNDNGVRRPATLQGEQSVPNVGGPR